MLGITGLLAGNDRLRDLLRPRLIAAGQQFFTGAGEDGHGLRVLREGAGKANGMFEALLLPHLLFVACQFVFLFIAGQHTRITGSGRIFVGGVVIGGDFVFLCGLPVVAGLE